MNELKPPRAWLEAGDRVLLCSACKSEQLQHAWNGNEIVFRCDDCAHGFALNIEQRDGRVCFMWHWLGKGE
jgi:hypothetical protein